MIKIYLIILIGFFCSVSCEIENRKNKNTSYINYIASIEETLGSRAFQLKSNNVPYTVLFIVSGYIGRIYLIKDKGVVLDSFLMSPGYFDSFHKINNSSLYFGVSETPWSASHCYIMEILNNKIHFSGRFSGDHYEHHACIKELGEDESKSWRHQYQTSLISIDTFGGFNKIKTLDVSVSQECTEKIWRNIMLDSFIYDTVGHVYYTKKITSEINLDTSSSKNTKKENILKIKGTFSIIDYGSDGYNLFYKGRWYYRRGKDSILKVLDDDQFKSYVPKYK